MSFELYLTRPYPSRDAARLLRGEVLNYLMRAKPEPGTRLGTEAKLMELSRLSRSTVRRALEPLEREGWIDRRVGAGTFVGARVRQEGNGEGASERLSPTAEPAMAPHVVRIAVLIFNIGDLAHDWYTPRIIEGIDDIAHEHAVSVELVGDRDGDSNSISRRLEHSRPNVLVCLSSEPRHAFVIRDAQKMGIHCIVAGTPHRALGVPSVSEDNRQAMRLAVQHLIEHGHRRIGLVIQRVVEPWVMERHEAFYAEMAEAGLTVDDSLVHWVAQGDPVTGRPESQEAVARYVETYTPTALIAGSYVPMMYLERLSQAGRLRVPGEVSLVSFEQNLTGGAWVDGMRPTYVRFPLREMGRAIANLARDLVAARSTEKQVVLSAELVPGDTVARVSQQS